MTSGWNTAAAVTTIFTLAGAAAVVLVPGARGTKPDVASSAPTARTVNSSK